MQQIDFAQACDVSRGGLLKWEKNESAPNAQALAAMAKMGVDVLFVVTGQCQGNTESTLAPAERELLQAWRDSDEKEHPALALMGKLGVDVFIS